MSFGDSLHQIEKNNSKIVSLEKIESLCIFRGSFREYREVALITDINILVEWRNKLRRRLLK